MGWGDIVLTGDEQPAFDINKLSPSQRAAYDRMMGGKLKNGPAPAAPAQATPLPQQVEPQPQARKWSDEVLGGPVAPQSPVAASPAAKQEGWGEWAYNSIAGRKDPREAGTGTVFDQFSDDRNIRHETTQAAILGASDAAMGDIIAKNLGDRFIRREKDANGYDVIVSRRPNGQEQRGYVNKPGLDMQDVYRGIYGALPYVATGGATGVALKGAGIGANALAQGAAAIGTSLSGDVGTILQGSKQAPDIGKAAIMGGFGAAGPVVGSAVGSLWRRFVTVPGLIDKGTGTLTAKGLEAAKAAGIDPADITPDFAQSFANVFAQTKNPAEAAIRAGTERYGIPVTEAEATKIPRLLTRDEAMARGLYGEKAETSMLGHRAKQAAAIKTAALGDPLNTNARSVAGVINPDRAYGSAPMPDDIGASIQSGLREARDAARVQENLAWEGGAKTLEATDEALKMLPDKLNASLGGLHINETATPKSSAMAKEIDRMITGQAPEKAAGWVANNPTRNVDQMRRTLLTYYQAADKGTDKEAAEAIYNGFNDWIGEAAGFKLLKGDPEAAMKLVEARGFTREVRETFSPRSADGTLSPAGARLAKILDPSKTDSGESVVQALLGSHGSNTPNSGAVGALRNIKAALDRYAPETGKQAWDDIRMAYWSRLVTNKGGDMLGAQAIVSNLKTALHGKDAIVQTLFTPAEQLEIRAFFRAVSAAAYKPTNASGSGYTAAGLIKDGLMKVLDSFGIGKPVVAGMNYTGLANAWNGANARATINQAVKPIRPNVTPLVTGFGQSYQNQSGGR